jgi:hypothetical protein
MPKHADGEVVADSSPREALNKNPCVFFATERDSANALLRRCFVDSSVLASDLLRAVLKRLHGDNWREHLQIAVHETSLPFFKQKTDGPWDIGIVFAVLGTVLPKFFEFINDTSLDDPTLTRERQALVTNVNVVYIMRNKWAHTPVSIEEAHTTAQSLIDALSALHLVMFSHSTPADPLPFSALRRTLKLLQSTSITAEWTVDEVAFVLLQRGLSVLCEGSRLLVLKCRKEFPDAAHVSHCYTCRHELGLCTSLQFCNLRRGEGYDEIRNHLATSVGMHACFHKCAERVQNCLHDVGSVVSHLTSCRNCMPRAPDKELHLVKYVRNHIFHSSSHKECASLALSALMCVDVLLQRLRRCESNHGRTMMQAKIKDVQKMQEQLQTYVQFPDARVVVREVGMALQVSVGSCKWLNSGVVSMMTEYDALKHVLFGSTPLPTSGCTCNIRHLQYWIEHETDKTANLFFIKSILQDLRIMSSSAYTEVSTMVSGSESLFEVSRNLRDRFAKNAASTSMSRVDFRFCRELEKIAGVEASESLMSDLSDVESIQSLLKSAGRQLSRPGVPLCPFAQTLASQGEHWLLLQHIVFSGGASDTVVDCNCVAKQDCKDARLVFAKEKLKRFKGLNFSSTDTFGRPQPTEVVHLIELAQSYGVNIAFPHIPIPVLLLDSSKTCNVFRMTPDALFAGRHGLVDRLSESMWTAVNNPHRTHFLLLHGDSGTGKTYAAIRVFHELQRKAQVSKSPILMNFICGNSASSVMRDFVKFGRALMKQLHPDECANDDEVVAKVTLILKEMRYAIFLDNTTVEGMAQLMQLLPVSIQGSSIIATSLLDGDAFRDAAAAVSDFCQECMYEFDIEEVSDCLHKSGVDPRFLQYEDDSKQRYERFHACLRSLSGLPILIAVLGSWLKTCSYDDFPNVISELMKFSGTDNPKPFLHHMVENVLNNAQITGKDVAETQLLAILAVCPSYVSWSLFDGMGLLANTDIISSELQCEESLRSIALRLQDYGLIAVDVDNRMLRMHHLVQSAIYSYNLYSAYAINFQISSSSPR